MYVYCKFLILILIILMLMLMWMRHETHEMHMHVDVARRHRALGSPARGDQVHSWSARDWPLRRHGARRLLRRAGRQRQRAPSAERLQWRPLMHYSLLAARLMLDATPAHLPVYSTSTFTSVLVDVDVDALTLLRACFQCFVWDC